MVSPPPKSSIRLYTYAMSPYAAKVHCFLLYKQLDFECFFVNPLRARHELPVGRQVPVLSVGEESRADSTPIGLWLDERFPDSKRLLPDDATERERLLSLDDWITNRLIPASFRSYPGEGIDRFVNGWNLSRVMANTAHSGLPIYLRLIWPLLITRVPFVRKLLAEADDGLPARESKWKLYKEFLARLEGGPFLGGRKAPSLADFAAYPQFALFYAHGFRWGDDILREPELMAWLERMGPHLKGDPPLVPRGLERRALP